MQSEATREIEDRVARGNELAVQLHDLIRGFYGRSAERLKLFRLQPRRPKVTSAAAKAQRKARREKKLSEEAAGPNPAQTADSETDGQNPEVKA